MVRQPAPPRVDGAGVRRRAVVAGMAAAGLMPRAAGSATPLPVTPRFRVIVDNDLSGDPDGLFQLAHQLASPATRVALVIGSHMRAGARADLSTHQARNAAARAGELMDRMRLAYRPDVVAGRDAAPAAGSSSAIGPAARRIVEEAMRDGLPLFYLAGAGLTDLSEALRHLPEIAGRMTLVWIGGPDPAPPEGSFPPIEYNLAIDIAAARTVFNDSGIAIWQVPRDVYRTLLVGHAELEEGLRGAGELGRYLLGAVDRVLRGVYPDMGETYIMGDSPLVTLTALKSSFDPDTASSRWIVQPTPRIDAEGRPSPDPGGRSMRRYTMVDTRLTLADMFAKLRAAGR